MFRRISLSVPAVLVTAIPLLAVAPAPAAPAAAAKPTPFAMGGSGYATRVIGGDVPAGSDRSAFAALGCTNQAGRERTNDAAEVDLGTGLSLANAQTRVWTTKRKGVVSSWSRQTIARVTLVDSAAGSLYLRGIGSTSRAWHDDRGFHASTTPRLGSIVLDPAVGDNETFPVPSPGESVTVPGVATIALGTGQTRRGRGGATAELDSLRIRVIPTGTRVFVGHSRAAISAGVKDALFAGSAYGAEARALDGGITTGKAPLLLMPCEGTNGKLRTNDSARVRLADNAAARGVSVSGRADSDRRGATMTTRAKITRVNLGGGLVIRGVVGVAHVEKVGGRYVRTDDGTTVDLVTLDGERLRLPDRGALEIPGLATLRPNVVDRSPNGIKVTALRVTLLDGRLTRIDLGNARALIRPSGN